MRCFYFGCWQRAGHFLWAPGGKRPDRSAWHLEHFDRKLQEPPHLDGGLAPRRMKHGGALCWAGQRPTPNDRRRLESESEECEQGQFLRHLLDTGYTAISWWDRCQGDKRGACNSTVLLEGEHPTERMLDALREHFPHVLDNLERHGVKLVEVTP